MKMEKDMSDQELLSSFLGVEKDSIPKGTELKEYVSQYLPVVEEISKRLISSKGRSFTGYKYTSEIREILTERYKGRKEEVYAVVIIDDDLHILGHEEICTGNIDMNNLDSIDVFNKVLKYPASILYHVHYFPKEIPNHPRESEIQFIKRMVLSANLLRISTRDMLYLSGDNYISFKEEGYVDFTDTYQ